ncbi:MAG TPA: adenylyltransferase/cytidyltransferase family protein [Candidatus Paceibacterota bacterium]|nr:adenylyltransferase/cytidyltransferase family protein [Candidatus Paceibacterota bacterium]
MKKGFTCGSFDLVHAGHVMMFKECRDHCDYLVVFLQTDPSNDRPGKNRPIMSVEERRTILEGIRYIDEIVTYDTEADLYRLLAALPAGTVRIIGEDWRGKPFTGHDLPHTVVFNSRGHHYSSSELRQRVYEAEAKKNGALDMSSKAPNERASRP